MTLSFSKQIHRWTHTKLMLIFQEDFIESIEQEPLYKCQQDFEETCHSSFVTVFSSHTEEKCDEHFEKKCQITFRQIATEEKIVNCYR